MSSQRIEAVRRFLGRGRRRARWMLLSVCCVLFGALTLAVAAQAATVTFTSTGAEQTFTVPAGVTSVHVVAIAGSGGNGGSGGGAGGAAAQVSGDLSVTPGQALFIEVAGSGQPGDSGGAGGFNGGAAGAGGGGGASDVRSLPLSAGLSPDRRLIVAAGSGGGAATGNTTGGAGGSAGSAGADDAGGANLGGGAGTSSAGGVGGFGCGSNGLDGQLGLGGAGGSFNVPGGGGGGGFFGGGGGGAGCNSGGGGGGGGSSLVPLGGSFALSVQEPQIQISYTQPTTPPPPPPPDKVAPSILSFGFGSSTFRAAGKGGSIAKAPVGTRVRYRVSEAGSARFTVERAAKGRKKGKRCVAPTKQNRKARRCTRYLRLKGSFSRASTAGLNSFRFTGRLRGKKLRPGRYRLVIVATDATGNKSGAKRAKFRIVLR